MNHRSLIGVVVALCAGLTRAAAPDAEALLKGVTEIATPGTPGTLCVFGAQASVVADAAEREGLRSPVVAAASLGKGRVVAFSHDGYLKAEALKTADTGLLVTNLVRWGAKDKPRVRTVGMRESAEWLKNAGFDAQSVAAAQWRGLLEPGAADVIWLPPNLPSSDEEVAAIRAFIERGGCVFFAVTGWGWQSIHKGQSLSDDLPANRLLAPLGIVFADGTVSEDKGAKGIRPSRPMPAELHVAGAIELLKKPDAGLLKDKAVAAARTQAAHTVMRACLSLPADAAPLKEIRGIVAGRGDALPSPENPLRASDGLARAALVLSLREAEAAALERVTAHPAAIHFPGAVPKEAQRVTKAVDVDTRVPRWHSTGLYAAPGEVIEVGVKDPVAGKGLRVRIGAHTDKTHHLPAWRRVPEISAAWAIDSPTTRAASAFGGLVYVEVPERSELGTINVTIANAVEAPRFVLGKTSVKAWRESIRNRPAPWAELATGKLIITLKSEAVRGLDDPTAVMEHWDRVMDACADLAGRPRERSSPERIVTDADISAGYMHSGYPIMTGLDVTHTLADLPKLKTVEAGWGFYHELGHNHQHPDWTFEGTGEVTVNLFTMYVLETVCGQTREAATARAIGAGRRAQANAKYLAAPDFEKWKDDPFLALAMYAQVATEFGWEPIAKAIGEYRTLGAGERPKTQQDKRDQWMQRLSRATGKNLGPFFEAWGVPTTAEARKAVAGLPGWMPAEMRAR